MPKQAMKSRGGQWLLSHTVVLDIVNEFMMDVDGALRPLGYLESPEIGETILGYGANSVIFPLCTLPPGSIIHDVGVDVKNLGERLASYNTAGVEVGNGFMFMVGYNPRKHPYDDYEYGSSLLFPYIRFPSFPHGCANNRMDYWSEHLSVVGNTAEELCLVRYADGNRTDLTSRFLGKGRLVFFVDYSVPDRQNEVMY